MVSPFPGGPSWSLGGGVEKTRAVVERTLADGQGGEADHRFAGAPDLAYLSEDGDRRDQMSPGDVVTALDQFDETQVAARRLQTDDRDRLRRRRAPFQVRPRETSRSPASHARTSRDWTARREARADRPPSSYSATASIASRARFGGARRAVLLAVFGDTRRRSSARTRVATGSPSPRSQASARARCTEA